MSDLGTLVIADRSNDGDHRIVEKVSDWQRIILTFLGMVFLLASVSKMVDLQSFAASLLTISKLPQVAVKVLVYALPALELSLAMHLLTGARPRETALYSLCLLGLFTTIAFSLAIGGNASGCHCFGESIEKIAGSSPWLAFVRNVGLGVTNVLFFTLEPK